MGAIASSVGWFVVNSSMAICRKVAQVENAAAATAGPRLAGSLDARAALAPIVGVLETNPEARPATGKQ